MSNEDGPFVRGIYEDGTIALAIIDGEWLRIQVDIEPDVALLLAQWLVENAERAYADQADEEQP